MRGRRRRRRRKPLDFLKERRGYFYLKKEALDRTMSRFRFGRGFGPFVRQTNKKYIYIYTRARTHTHTHTYIHMHKRASVCICLCVCVCRCNPLLVHTPSSPDIDLDSAKCRITFLRHVCRRIRR